MKKIQILFIISVIAMASCHSLWWADRVLSFWIKNNSEEKVYLFVSENYPDTLVLNAKGALGLDPGEEMPFDFNDDEWEDLFARLPADTLSLFFVKGDTFKGLDNVLEKYDLLERREISLDDLKNNNFLVSYP